MYSLQKYAGPSSRHVCPACGRPHCFTYYVDEQGNELDPTVGKCDHDSSCHYHKTPAEFFRENPDKRPGPDWRYQKVDWLEAKKQKMKILPVATCFIPPDIVLRSVRPQVESDFTTFLLSIFDPVVVEDLVNDYQLGVTSKRDVIFFQLDLNGSCRTGKIMKYDPETGHRIKDENQPNRINWVHSLMKQGGRLPADWQLTQCLFGEHLLRQYPNKVVALVESEKTAVICAGLMPRFLWLATGGKSQINDRLLVLKGRKVVAFPDVDEAHIDIADWLLRYMFGSPSEEVDKWHLEFLKAAEFISPEHHAEVEAMIHDLELEFWGAVRIEAAPEDPP